MAKGTIRTEGAGEDHDVHQILYLTRKKKEEESQELIQELRQDFQREIQNHLKNKVFEARNLKTHPRKLGIALVASPGVGKTSFINALNYLAIKNPRGFVPLAQAAGVEHVTRFTRQVKIMEFFYFHDMVGVDCDLAATLDYMHQMTTGKLRSDQTLRYANVALEPISIGAFIFMVSAKPEKEDVEVEEHTSWNEFFKLLDEFTAFEKHPEIYRPYVVVMTHARSKSAKHLKAKLEAKIPESSLCIMDNRFGEEGLTRPLALDLTRIMEKLINSIANDLVVPPPTVEVTKRVYFEVRDGTRWFSRNLQVSLLQFLLVLLIALVAYLTFQYPI